MALIGAPFTRDHFPNAAEANLRKAYFDNMNLLDGKKFYTRIYNVRDSSIKIERDAVYGGYGTYNLKAEGAAIALDAGQEARTQSYTHKSYALGVHVTLEAQQDDPHGITRWLTRSGGGLAKTGIYTMESNAMDVFNTLLTSGTLFSQDGTNYALLSTTHARIDGGTWSNRPASALDLSIEALEFMTSHWMVNQLNQRGQVTMTTPKTLLVGANDGPLAHRLVETTGRRPQGADNDINYMDRFGLDIIVHPLLTNDGRWLALGPKGEHKLNYFERMKPDVLKLPDGDNGNMRFYAIFRESHGATGSEGVWGSP